MNERADIDGVTLSMSSPSSFPADGLVEWECLYIDWEAVRILLTLIPLPCRPLLAPLTLAPSTFLSLSPSLFACECVTRFHRPSDAVVRTECGAVVVDRNCPYIFNVEKVHFDCFSASFFRFCPLLTPCRLQFEGNRNVCRQSACC